MKAYKVFINRNNKLFSAGRIPKDLVFHYPKKEKGFIWPKVKRSRFFVFEKLEEALLFVTCETVNQDDPKPNFEIWEVEVKNLLAPKGEKVWRGMYTLPEIRAFWRHSHSLFTLALGYEFSQGAMNATCLRLVKKV